MAYVIRFFDGKNAGYWTGATADTDKQYATLYKEKQSAENVMKKLSVKKGIEVKIIQDIWNRKRKPKSKKTVTKILGKKKNPYKEKKIVESFIGKKLPISKLTAHGAVLGKVTRIDYLSESDGKKFIFSHKFQSKPHLVVEKSGKRLAIQGGGFIVRSTGINDTR